MSLAAVSWGTTGSVNTILAECAGAPPLLVGSARMLIAAVSSSPRALATRARLPRESRRHAVAMGVCMAAYQVFFFLAVPVTDITVPVGASARQASPALP